jgi:hypothetical protein
MAEAKPVGFVAFFLLWAKVQGWKVPLLHVRICHWLETCAEPVRVLMVFRGASKSTIYAVYKAWLLYRNRSRRSLIWAADDKLATKLTRDTLNVLRRHPLCGGMLPRKPGAQSFWVNGSTDARNPSMEAVGVSSNSTGSRADDVDFDDIEVPKNIKTPEARQNLRLKIEESTHIAVPGAQKTYIGTPHTHDSVYTEQIAGGAAVLKIPLFEHHIRYPADKTGKATRYTFPFTPGADGLYVFTGIGKPAQLLKEGKDYRIELGGVVFAKPPGQLLDIYAGCAWADRFNRADIEQKRKDTRTINGWDSQYQLEAKPLSDVRLDPSRIVPYEVEPRIITANGALGPVVRQGQFRRVRRGAGPAGRGRPALLAPRAEPVRTDRGDQRRREESHRRPGAGPVQAGGGLPGAAHHGGDQRHRRVRAVLPAHGPEAAAPGLRHQRRTGGGEQEHPHPGGAGADPGERNAVGAHQRARWPAVGPDEGLEPRSADAARRPAGRRRRRGDRPAGAGGQAGGSSSRESDQPSA